MPSFPASSWHSICLTEKNSDKTGSRNEPTPSNLVLIEKESYPGASPGRSGETITNILKKKGMKKYICTVCDWVYDPEVGDPESGIAPGTAFEDIPDDWVCPVCGVGKEEFEVVEE